MKKKPPIKDISLEEWKRIEKDAEARDIKEHIRLSDDAQAEAMLSTSNTDTKDSN